MEQRPPCERQRSCSRRRRTAEGELATSRAGWGVLCVLRDKPLSCVLRGEVLFCVAAVTLRPARHNQKLLNGTRDERIVAMHNHEASSSKLSDHKLGIDRVMARLERA